MNNALPAPPRAQDPTPAGTRSRRLPSRILALGVASLLAASGLLAGATPAMAADTVAVTDATIEWGLNMQHQEAAQAGGCDFFSAGFSNGTAAQYRTQEGNVLVVKRLADGSAASVTAANRCTDNGAGQIGQRLIFGGGTGSTDRATGASTVSWTGTATVNSYGGMLPWTITDPTLTVNDDKTAQLTATFGGFASSMENPDVSTPIRPVPGVVIANFRDVAIVDGKIQATPVFSGVDYYPIVDGVRQTQSAISEALKLRNPQWGSWPQSFVDAQYTTGLSTYWHTSGLSGDSKKPPLPVTVSLDAATPATAPVIVRSPAAATVTEGVDARFAVEFAGSPRPAVQWQKKPSGGAWADIAGATSAAFTVGQPTLADTASAYRAIVSNASGTVTSGEAALTVQERKDILILTHPASANVAAGSSLSLTVSVSGSAPRYQWQRSTDGGTTWNDWGGTAARSSAVPTGDASANGNQYRVIVSNGVSEPVTSNVATVTLTSTPITVASQPASVTTYVGGQVQFAASVSGSPSPSRILQSSRDGGATWQTLDDNSVPLYYVYNVTADMDGMLVRAAISNGGFQDTVYTKPATVTVLPANGRALGVTPDSVVDPRAAASRAISVNGVGFAPAAGSTAGLRIGVMEAATWRSEGNRKAADLTIAASSTVLNVLLTRDNGTFARTVTIPSAATSKLNPDTEYLLVAFSTLDGDRSLDYAQPFVLSGQDFAATAAPAATEAPTAATAPRRDLGLGTHDVGDALRVSGLVPNSWNYLTAFSEPTGLGWLLSDADGVVRVELPDSVEPGEHTLQVQNTAGTVTAWQNFVLRDGDAGTESDSDADTGADTDGGADSDNGSEAGADSGAGTETDAGTDSDTGSESGAGADSDSGSNAGSASDTDIGSDAGTEADGGSDSDATEAGVDAEAETDADVNAGSDSDATSDAEAGPGADSDAGAEAGSETDAATNGDADSGDDAAAEAASDSDSDVTGGSAAGTDTDTDTDADSDSTTIIHPAPGTAAGSDTAADGNAAPSTGTLSATGANGVWGTLSAAALLLAAGAGVLTVRRRTHAETSAGN